ncbi:regulator of protease activity HflC (stomatin/prohibitin superfamily) [Bradyrhizobium sp. AZCC 2176]
MVRSRDNAVVPDRWPYRRALAAIAALGLVAAVGSLCFFTVDSADYAIVTDFGKPTQVITAPGLGFKHPLQSVRLPPGRHGRRSRMHGSARSRQIPDSSHTTTKQQSVKEAIVA